MFDWASHLSNTSQYAVAGDICGTREMCSSSEQPQGCPENQLASWWSWNVDSTLASLSRKDCLQRSRTIMFYDVLWCFMMFYVVLCIFPLQLAAFVALLYLRPWGNLCWEASRWDHLEPSCKKAFVELLVWWCLWKPWHLIYLTLLKRFVLETKRLEIGLWRTWCCRTGGVWCWRICVWELQEPSVAMWIRQGARGVIITVEKAASWTSTNIRCLNLVFRNSMKLCNRDQKGTFKALLGEERSHPRMRFETHRHTLALTPANLFRTMFGRPCTLWNLGNWESSFRLFQKLPNPSEICDFRQRGYTLGDLISRDLYDTERVLGSKSLLWTHSNMTQWPMSRPKAVEIWWNM